MSYNVTLDPAATIARLLFASVSTNLIDWPVESENICEYVVATFVLSAGARAVGNSTLFIEVVLIALSPESYLYIFAVTGLSVLSEY